MRRLLIFVTLQLSLLALHAEVVWFDGQHPITYQLPKKAEPVVMTALDMWKGDMLQVTGMTPVASAKATIN